MRRRFFEALPCLALAILLPGCAPRQEESSPEIAAALASLQEDRPHATTAGVVEHDFGAILAHGQTLKHEFPLTNHTGRAIRLLKAEAMTPCCSAIGPWPDLIPPGGQARLPVTFRVGFQSGRKRVTFLVQTDQSDRPLWRFALVAFLTAEVEATLQPGSDTTVKVGQSGRQAFSILCRQIGEKGRGAPASVHVTAPLSAALLGPAHRNGNAPEGVIETTQAIEVILPASNEEGIRRGELEIRWTEGTPFTIPIQWTVSPHLRAVPPGLVLNSSDDRAAQGILVQSESELFRILKVSGPLLAECLEPLPTEPKPFHNLRLVLDPSKAKGNQTSDLIIRTDHPTQAIIRVSVLALGKGTGAQP